MSKLKSKTLRTITVVAVIVLVGVGFILNTGIGTLSAFGWSDLSILCPLGALGTMLASKLLVPQALISLVFAVLFIILLGRVFCAWICPVPLVSRVRGLFAKKSRVKDVKSIPDSDLADEKKAAEASAPLTKEEEKALSGCSSDCSSCASKRQSVDARHFILGGSLLSAAIFGFPVFCLVCPIGLSFASILLVVRLFSGGDVTWSLIVVPFILIAEVVLFKKWCHKLCPLSAFMSLVGKANRTFQPSLNDSKCLETTKGRACGVCGKVCEEGINPRHPELGIHAMNECTRCRACVDACPTGAISIPFWVKKNKEEKKSEDDTKEGPLEGPPIEAQPE